MIDPTVLRGFSDAYGSWKIICMSRRSSRSSAASELGDVPSLEPDPALGGIEQPHHDARERGLAAPGLAHEPDGLARVDLEVDAVDRVDVADVVLDQDALRDREVLLEALDTDQRLALGRGAAEASAR